MEEKRYPAEKSAEIQKLLDTATLFVGLSPESLDRSYCSCCHPYPSC
jgi:hypothetical protein